MALRRWLLVQHIGGWVCNFVGLITSLFLEEKEPSEASWVVITIAVPSVMIVSNIVMAATVTGLRFSDRKRWLLVNLVTVLFLLLLSLAIGSSVSFGCLLYRSSLPPWDTCSLLEIFLIPQITTWVNAVLMLAMLIQYAYLYLQETVSYQQVDAAGGRKAAGGHNDSSSGALPPVAAATTYSTFVSSGSVSVTAAMTNTGRPGGGLTVGKLTDLSSTTTTGSDAPGPPSSSRRIPSSPRSEVFSRSYQQPDDDDSLTRDWRRSARLSSYAELGREGRGRPATAMDRKAKGKVKTQFSFRRNFDGSGRDNSPPSTASKLLRPQSCIK